MLDKTIIEQEWKDMDVKEDCIIFLQYKNGELSTSVGGHAFSILGCISKVIQDVCKETGLNENVICDTIKDFIKTENLNVKKEIN